MEIVIGAVVGVMTFLTGQYVIRMILDPLARLRRTTAQISLCLLSNQSKLSNCQHNEALAAELRNRGESPGGGVFPTLELAPTK